MSDNLVKRYRMQGDYSDWWMVEVDGDGDGDGDGYDDASETEWSKANDHAAALVAKDAEIARLRGIINDLIDAAENDRRRAQHKGETP